MGFEAFLISFLFRSRMTKPHPSGACRGRSGRSAGAMRRSPAPSALTNQSPPAPPQDSPSRGKPNFFGHFRHRSPDDFRPRPETAPSLFGNFRKPGREAAERVRASPARQARPGDRRAAALRPSQTCGCCRGPSARRKDTEPPRCPLGASGQRQWDGRCRRGAG